MSWRLEEYTIETLNTYSHLFPSDLTEIVNIINDLE